MSEHPTLHEWAGGGAAFRRLIDSFYDRVEHDEVLRQLFPGGVGGASYERDQLVDRGVRWLTHLHRRPRAPVVRAATLDAQRVDALAAPANQWCPFGNTHSMALGATTLQRTVKTSKVAVVHGYSSSGLSTSELSVGLRRAAACPRPGKGISPDVRRTARPNPRAHPRSARPHRLHPRSPRARD